MLKIKRFSFPSPTESLANKSRNSSNELAQFDTNHTLYRASHPTKHQKGKKEKSANMKNLTCLPKRLRISILTLIFTAT